MGFFICLYICVPGLPACLPDVNAHTHYCGKFSLCKDTGQTYGVEYEAEPTIIFVTEQN
jgi:hypothetical protein